MNTATCITALSVLIVMAVSAISFKEPGMPDLKLALAALSACIAVHSAWVLNWRKPCIRVVPNLPSSGDDGKKRLLAVINNGATPTCFRIHAVSSTMTPADRTYAFDTATVLVDGRSFVQIPITLTRGTPEGRDTLHVEYFYYVDVRYRAEAATIEWEGQSNDGYTKPRTS